MANAKERDLKYNMLAGIGSFFGVEMPIFAVALILIGLSALSKVFFENVTE